MARSERFLVGKHPEHSQDAATGVLTQNPSSTLSTVGGLKVAGTVADVAVGQEITLLTRVGIDENSPADATTYSKKIFDKNCPFKLKVMEAGFRVEDLTTTDFTDGDAGNLDLEIDRGDGASSETVTEVLATFALDDDYANGTGNRFPSPTVGLVNDLIVEGGSLIVNLIVDPDATAGATNDGAMVDVWVRCLRVL